MVWNLSIGTAVDEKMARVTRGFGEVEEEICFQHVGRPFQIASSRTGRRYCARLSSVGVSTGNQ